MNQLSDDSPGGLGGSAYAGAAVLDALPIPVVLLDAQGVVRAVNQAWRRVASVNAWLAADAQVGLSYAGLCDAVTGPAQADAGKAADAVRAVLSGRGAHCALDYPGHATPEQRWYRMTVTPLLADDSGQGSSAVVTGAAVMHLDISENKLAELERERERQLLRATLESLSDGFCTLDRRWRMTFVNRRAGRMLGHTSASLLGEVLWDRLPAIVGTAFEGALRRAMGARVMVQLVDCFVPGDRCYELRIHPSVEGLSVHLRDVTHQHRLARQLATERSRLVDAQAVARIGSWTTNLVTLASEWSAVTHHIFETDPQHFQPTFELFMKRVHPHDRKVLVEAFQRSREDFQARVAEHRLILPSGAAKVVEQRWRILRDQEGRAAQAFGTCQDITERKLAEAENQQLATRLANTLESITDGFFTVDRAWRFTYINAQGLRLLGMARDKVVGQVMWLLFPKAVGTEFESGYRRAMGGERGVAFEGEVATMKSWVSVHCYPSEEGLSVYFRDIGEQRRDREALRDLNADLEARVLARTAELNLARDEAEHANRAKSSFLAAMSHEIRTPMNGVIGMIDVLHQTGLQPDQREMVELIRDSAFSLLAVVEDVLDFSKIEAGKLTVELRPMQLEALIEKVCGMLDPMAVKRGIRLDMFVDPALPRTLAGDAGRLRQVLVNLGGNAVKFTGGANGPGRVSVRALLVEQQAATVTVDLVVSDNGIGMDEATQAQLFTPFSQGDESITRRFGGTGLGLAISDTLVRLMGGGIEVRSAPGRGSTFTARLQFAALDDGADQDALRERGAALAGLCGRIVGAEQPLAGDLGAYLRSAGALVEHSLDLAAAAAAPAPPGLCLWLILPGETLPDLAALRAMAPSTAPAETRFVVLGSGKRRHPRMEAADLVRLDADVLCRRTLFKLLNLAAGPARPETQATQTEHARSDARTDARRAPLVTARPDPGSASEGRLILVAEDNETNRKVILLQLQLIGFTTEVVVNGNEALQRWRSGDHALVLTDLHMPEMDGYALARAIRSEEDERADSAGRVARRTPIIALTANAMPDEEQRCLAAGMNAYLTKPVRMARLKAVIDGCLVPNVETEAAPSSGAPVDLAVLVALIGDDPAGIAEVLRSFRDSAARSGAALSQALSDHLPSAAADAAHRLKSGARSIGAARLADLCAEVEQCARPDAPPTKEAASLCELVPQLLDELTVVLRWLDAEAA